MPRSQFLDSEVTINIDSLSLNDSTDPNTQPAGLIELPEQPERPSVSESKLSFFGGTAENRPSLDEMSCEPVFWCKMGLAISLIALLLVLLEIFSVDESSNSQAKGPMPSNTTNPFAL